MPFSMPSARIFGLVTKMSSPTSWTLLPSAFVRVAQPAQSFSPSPSSIETIGYSFTHFSYIAISWSEVFVPAPDFLSTYVLPSSWNSEAATSNARAICSPGL